MIFEDSFIKLAMEIFTVHRDLEKVISTLKDHGANQLQTAYALHKGLGLPLNEVDKIVLNSPTWTNQLESNTKIKEQFFNDEDQ